MSELHARSLRIAEIFASIQGEGHWLGTPSTFVRISGCNLRCGWCDTPYASWEPEGPVREVADIASEASSMGIHHVVLTGGEPMLFDALVPLANRLSAQGHVVTIETAGTVYQDLACDLMSISPKLSHSAPDASLGMQERHEKLRLNLGVLSQLIARYPYQLKFVMNPEGPMDDVGEIEALLNDLPGVSPEKVMLMAEGRDATTLRRREKMLVPLCIAKGWRLTPRYQIDLFGDVRGT